MMMNMMAVMVAMLCLTKQHKGIGGTSFKTAMLIVVVIMEMRMSMRIVKWCWLCYGETSLKNNILNNDGNKCSPIINDYLLSISIIIFFVKILFLLSLLSTSISNNNSLEFSSAMLWCGTSVRNTFNLFPSTVNGFSLLLSSL